jgi:repressor LexA
MAMRRKSLSERQRKVLSFIAQFQYRHGYAPSIREIGDEVGLGSSSSVAYQLTQLENRGYIRRTRRARSSCSSRWMCPRSPVPSSPPAPP